MGIDLKKDILEIVLLITIPSFLILLSWVARLVAAFIKIKVIEIEARIKNDKIKTSIEVVNDDATNIIYMLNQTVVDSLREASADGKLDAGDIADVKRKAYNMLNRSLSDDIKYTLSDTFGDLDVYLNNVIEKSVAKAKTGKSIKINAEPLGDIDSYTPNSDNTIKWDNVLSKPILVDCDNNVETE